MYIFGLEYASCQGPKGIQLFQQEWTPRLLIGPFPFGLSFREENALDASYDHIIDIASCLDGSHGSILLSLNDHLKQFGKMEAKLKGVK